MMTKTGKNILKLEDVSTSELVELGTVLQNMEQYDAIQRMHELHSELLDLCMELAAEEEECPPIVQTAHVLLRELCTTLHSIEKSSLRWALTTCASGNTSKLAAADLRNIDYDVQIAWSYVKLIRKLLSPSSE